MVSFEVLFWKAINMGIYKIDHMNQVNILFVIISMNAICHPSKPPVK
jgi:hypothetical protein